MAIRLLVTGLCLSFAVCLVNPAWADTRTEIKRLRVGQSPDRTRVVLDISNRVEHKVSTLADPFRLVIDLHNAKVDPELVTPSDLPAPIDRVRLVQRNESWVRVVFDLSREVSYKSFSLEPGRHDGIDHSDRLVIDLQKVPDAYTPAPQPASQLVVVLDPGHGGQDPGAVGHGGVYEKDVVLAIARLLKLNLEAEPGVRVVMTRTGDYYVRHARRKELATEEGAGLFVSIHADAFTNTRARGASVYMVSVDGASSETAHWLAERANRSDVVGGISLRDHPEPYLVEVLVDLSMHGNQLASKKAGDLVLESLKRGKIGLHKADLEQAGFVVLKTPKFPSLLIETGFISNPQDARALADPGYRKTLAAVIGRGLLAYLDEVQRNGLYAANRPQNAPTNYVIRSGDTLSEIAVRHQVSTEELRSFNHLRSDTIRIGQILRIPLKNNL